MSRRAGCIGAWSWTGHKTASAEVDDVHRNAVAGSFRMALLEARERGRAVN